MSYVTGEWSPSHLNLKQQKDKKKNSEKIYIHAEYYKSSDVNCPAKGD